MQNIWFYLAMAAAILIVLIEPVVREIRWHRKNPIAMEKLARDDDELDRRERR